MIRWALRLQEFSFQIKYRPGPQNAAADALSRCFATEIEEEPAPQNTNAVLPIDLLTLWEEQRRDPALQTIMDQSTSGQDTFPYLMQDDILHKFLPRSQDDEFGEGLKIVVPKSMISALLSPTMTTCSVRT